MEKDNTKLLLSDEEHEELKKDVLRWFTVSAAELVGSYFGLLFAIFILRKIKK